MKLNFYTTDGCHLCEEAKLLLIPYMTGSQIEVSFIDIIESEQLMELYDVKIPVIKRCDTNNELDWPFDSEQLIKFLQR